MYILYLAPPALVVVLQLRMRSLLMSAEASSTVLVLVAMSVIPVVDLESIFSVAELGSCPQVDQIHSAFSTVGFVFVKNHGIARKTVRVHGVW